MDKGRKLGSRTKALSNSLYNANSSEPDTLEDLMQMLAETQKCFAELSKRVLKVAHVNAPQKRWERTLQLYDAEDDEDEYQPDFEERDDTSDVNSKANNIRATIPSPEIMKVRMILQAAKEENDEIDGKLRQRKQQVAIAERQTAELCAKKRNKESIEQWRIKESAPEESWKHDMYHQIYDRHSKLEDQPASRISAEELEESLLEYPEHEMPVNDVFMVPQYPVEKAYVGSVSMDRDLVSRSEGDMTLLADPGVQTELYSEQDADDLPSPLRRPLNFGEGDSSNVEDAHSEFSTSLQSLEANKPAEALPTPPPSEKPGKYVRRRPSPSTKVPLRRPKCATPALQGQPTLPEILNEELDKTSDFPSSSISQAMKEHDRETELQLARTCYPGEHIEHEFNPDVNEEISKREESHEVCRSVGRPGTTAKMMNGLSQIQARLIQISKGVLPDKKLELERNDTEHYRNEETYKVIEEQEEVVEEVEDVIEEEEVVVEEEELVEEEVVVEEENLERNGFHTSNNNDDGTISASSVVFLMNYLEAKIVFKAYAPSSDPLNKPIGIAQLESGHIIVADTFNNRMMLFDEAGKVLGPFYSSSSLYHPSAVVELEHGGFAVKDNNSISVFSSEFECCKVIAKGKLSRPYGLTVNAEGLLVTVETSLTGNLTIVTLNPGSGNVESRVKVDLGLSSHAKSESKPRFIAWQGEHRLLVVDLGLNCVYIIDAFKGVVLKRFGEYGQGRDQMHDPSGIVCDGDGFILLGDSRNHRILIYDPDGRYISVLEVDVPVRRPSGLYLTSSGNLLILNYWENSVAAYRFQEIGDV
ncbi:RING finger protein nhl-1 isoform X2 [Penaeus vannamei]|uniref:RING finger protein nhl-1 isoform X2 n=1 Tax=Penaeus vannamei TaxID=6689 RepID=UPI00387F93C5